MINKFKWHLMILSSLIASMILARFGFEDSDTGFIVGLGWRALNGEMPYLDYSYVRPPISIIHSYILMLLTPENYQLWSLRAFSSILLLLSCILGITALDNEYNLKDNKIKLILCSYLISQYCLSTMMLWHTIDGIFYASIGVYFTSLFSKNGNNLHLILAAFSFVLSVLAKQNFLAPLVVFVLLTTIKEKHKSLYVVVTCIVLFVSFNYILKSLGVSSEFYSSITGKTHLVDIVRSSIYPYISWFFSKYFLALFLLSFAFIFSLNKLTNKGTNPYFLMLPIACSFLFVSIYSFGSVDPVRFFRLDHFIPFLIATSFVFLLIKSKEKINFINKYQILIISLSISWSASVSWGFNSPLLYSAPIISFYFIIKNSANKKIINSTLIISFIYTLNILTPYRSPSIDNLTYDMGGVSNKASGVLASKETFEKYQELAKLNEKYNLSTSTILPSMPLPHYLFGKENPYYIDWAMDVESNLSRIDSIGYINSCCSYVFIERKRIGQPIGKPGTRFYSSITDYVLSDWKIIEEKEYFSVYKKSKSQSAIDD